MFATFPQVLAIPFQPVDRLLEGHVGGFWRDSVLEEPQFDPASDIGNGCIASWYLVMESDGKGAVQTLIQRLPKIDTIAASRDNRDSHGLEASRDFAHFIRNKLRT